jgi:hypothetical protein
MSADIPDKEPLFFVAGDLVQWRREDLSSDFPASTWTLKYYLVKTSDQEVITASADGDDYAISIAAATTANYSPGVYTWQARVSKSTEIHVIDRGQMEVLTDFEQQSSGYDARTTAKTILDAISAVLEGRATKDQ